MPWSLSLSLSLDVEDDDDGDDEEDAEERNLMGLQWHVTCRVTGAGELAAGEIPFSLTE